MLNFYFKDTIESFISKSVEEIIGSITIANQFETALEQIQSWKRQIPILKEAIHGYSGTIFFEFSIPRMGKRVDVMLIIDGVVFVIEFKVGERDFLQYQIDQVWDYALDLKNFHEPSHNAVLVPILISTESQSSFLDLILTRHDDNLTLPMKSGAKHFGHAINKTLEYFADENIVNAENFASGSYAPTPTIIEAAVSLYNTHTVEQITKRDAGTKNLTRTNMAVSQIIADSKQNGTKAICFVTGVPGAGKTLVGLDIATSHLDKSKGDSSVYLSGNGPLVAILQEALTRDKVSNESRLGNKMTKGKARESIKSFIQIIHHYRDAYLVDPKPPFDHVAIFDEAQRAWNKEQTVSFMRRKKNQPDFDESEPEYLISCLDRHKDWAVVVCLVGGGQEINTGEAGISEWINAIYDRFPSWEVHVSPNLTDSEYSAVDSIKRLESKTSVTYNPDLHLAVSMRSFRAENVSLFVKYLLDLRVSDAQKTLQEISADYPIVLTRDLSEAKKWLKEQARGSERYGMVVSSQAQRLKPFAIDVKTPMNPVNWFLDGKDDVRSSYFLEDVATEFHVQGLELDWACVVWDGDLRYSPSEWKTFSFVGSKWQNIHKAERKQYLINAYRVLLTRARQGMVIVVPEGNSEDLTRKSEFYDQTFEYLKSIGIEII